MIYLSAAISLIVVITIGLWWCAHYARWDIERLAALKRWSDDYFDSATTIAMSKQTPTQLLIDIQVLNRTLDGSRESQKLIKILKIIPNRIKTDLYGTEIREFLRRENLADVYRKMAMSYILTISYKDRVRGHLIRQLIASDGQSGGMRDFIGRFAQVASEKAEELITSQERIVGGAILWR